MQQEKFGERSTNKSKESNRSITNRFSLFATNGALQIKTSWQEKEERRKRLQRTKELEKSITERRIEEKRVHIDHLKLSM